MNPEEGLSRQQGPGVSFEEYFPCSIGMIAALHATYYHRHWGFDKSFEIQVARELADFMDTFDPSRDGIWIAMKAGTFAGSVAVDGTRWPQEGARLRWFIVEPSFHAQGIGTALLQQAVCFCREKGFPSIFLWTFRGLEQARRLYERQGLQLTLEHEVLQWGGRILEQRFDLALPL